MVAYLLIEFIGAALAGFTSPEGRAVDRSDAPGAFPGMREARLRALD
jgi:hypothetical protein